MEMCILLLLCVAEQNYIIMFLFGLKKHLSFKENTLWNEYEVLGLNTSVPDLYN